MPTADHRQFLNIYRSLSLSLLEKNHGDTINAILTKLKKLFSSRDAYVLFIDESSIRDVFADFSSEELTIPLNLPRRIPVNKEGEDQKVSIQFVSSPRPVVCYLGEQKVENRICALFYSYGKPFVIFEFMNLSNPDSGYLNLLSELSYLIGPIFFLYREESRTTSSIQRQSLEMHKELSKYKEFWKNAHDAMVYLSVDGDIEFWNPAANALLDIEGPDGPKISNIKERLLHAVDYKVLQDVVRRNRTVMNFELLIHNPNYQLKKELGNFEDAVIYCSSSVTGLLNEAGNLRSMILVMKDITEQMQQSNQLLKANMQLIELNDTLHKQQRQLVQQEKLASIGNLAAGIAHEINNPLSFLKSNHNSLKQLNAEFTEYLKKATEALINHDLGTLADSLEKDLNEMADILRESDEGFKRIIQIVTGLRDFSRIDKKDEVRRIDLNEAVIKTLVVAKNQYKYVATIDFKRAKDVEVDCIPDRINQVLLNLIVNAAQAIKHEKRQSQGIIAISITGRENDVMIRVQDNGPGIPDEIRDRIFDPFFTTKDVGEGTGLGLSISRDIIVAKHNGDLRVENLRGGGTTMVVILPREYRRKEPDSEADPGESRASESRDVIERALETGEFESAEEGDLEDVAVDPMELLRRAAEE